jgi:hypothetical protein
MGWMVNVTSRPLYPWERPRTHHIGSWVGPKAGPDGCGKSRLHWDSIPGPPGPWRVAIPTQISRPTVHDMACGNVVCSLVSGPGKLNWGFPCQYHSISSPHTYSFTYHPHYRVLAIKMSLTLEITVVATWTVRCNNKNLFFLKERHPFGLLIVQQT